MLLVYNVINYNEWWRLERGDIDKVLDYKFF
jgi:hypothetical protein